MKNLIAVALIILFAIVFFVLERSNSENEKISELKYINDSLSKVNDSIFKLEKNYQTQLKAQNSIISKATQDNYSFVTKIDALNNRIYNLKIDYAKVIHYADNFNDSAIQRYFADSLR